jgi:hypothetical protein
MFNTFDDAIEAGRSMVNELEGLFVCTYKGLEVECEYNKLPQIEVIVSVSIGGNLTEVAKKFLSHYNDAEYNCYDDDFVVVRFTLRGMLINIFGDIDSGEFKEDDLRRSI